MLETVYVLYVFTGFVRGHEIYDLKADPKSTFSAKSLCEAVALDYNANFGHIVRETSGKHRVRISFATCREVKG